MEGSEPDSEEATEETPDTVDPPLSKNQMKKRSRREAYLKLRGERTELRKKKKKAAQERRKQERKDGGLEKEEEKIASEWVGCCGGLSRAERRKQEFLQKCAKNPVIVIDCMFEELQTEKEVSSLSQQLMYSYGLNRKSEFPFRLYLCGLYTALENSLRRISGFEDWTCHKSNQSCCEVLGLNNRNGERALDGTTTPLGAEKKEINHDADILDDPNVSSLLKTDLQSSSAVPINFEISEEAPSQSPSSKNDLVLKEVVYLTADSGNILESLDPDCAYIIGGLVDRNRYPRLTATRAESWGIKTARLPIQDNCELGGSKVLTVNQVLEILSQWMTSSSWKDAICAAVPSRKLLGSDI